MPASTRVMRAMATPVSAPRSAAARDDGPAARGIARASRAPAGSLALAVSCCTAAMETAVANLVAPSSRVVSVVNGYFGERLAAMAERHGATVARVSAEWGQAIDPPAVAAAIERERPALVTVVHADIDPGVRNPVADVAAAALCRRCGDLVVDTVTSLGGMPVDVGAWGADACYSAGQKRPGAPSGLSPIVFTPRALDAACRAAASTWIPSPRAGTGLAAGTITPSRRRWSTRSRKRSRRSRTKVSIAAGVLRAASRGAHGRTRLRRSVSRSSCRLPIRLGRSTRRACPRASTRPPCAACCASSTHSRLAPGSGRSRAACGASA